MSRKISKRQRKRLELEKKRKQILNFQYEINGLKKRIDDQNKMLAKENVLKNIKKFGCVCNFVTPFIVTTALTIGATKALGGGYPFVLDDRSKSKKYTLESQVDGTVDACEEYINTNLYFTDLKTNKLKVYFPYILEDDGTYKRVIRNYEVVDVLNVYNAILNDDIESALGNVILENEIVETTKTINEQNNGYHVEAFLNYIDHSNLLMVPESELKNILITLSSIIISLSLGGIVTKLRDFKLKLSLEHINKDYASLVEYKESLETKLLITEEKLLVLKKGSVSNER